MEGAQNLYLSLGLMLITSKPLEMACEILYGPRS